MKMRTFAVAAAFVAVTISGLSAPAEASDAKHSAKYTACHEMRLVLHRGSVNKAHPRIGPNEDTMPAFKKAVHLATLHPNFATAKVIETDTQPTRDHKLAILHDATLNRTTNMSGRLSRLPWSKVRRARTPAGDHIPSLYQLVLYMVDHTHVELQLESKIYGDNWSDGEIADLAQMFVKHNLLGRVSFSSASLSFLQKLDKALKTATQNVNFQPPNRYEWIGFGTHGPSPFTAKQSGLAIQLNVVYKRAFSPYNDSGQTYIGRSRSLDLPVSTRSFPDGTGDTGRIWSREISAGAVQIVTNNPERYYSWCNAA
jgi:glycerophosphoryl diester phosphodiesterase